MGLAEKKWIEPEVIMLSKNKADSERQLMHLSLYAETSVCESVYVFY